MTARTVTGESPWVLGAVPGERCVCRLDKSGACYIGHPAFDQCPEDNKPPDEFDGIPLACDSCNDGVAYDGDMSCWKCSECVSGAPIIDLVRRNPNPNAGIVGRTVRASVHAAPIVDKPGHWAIIAIALEDKRRD